MARGIRLFRILGIRISIDYSWFIVFAIFAWSLAYGYFPYYHPGLERNIYLLMGLVSAFLLFACVLIHELSHSVTANRLGLDISEITLFIFGGVAKLTKEPEDAKTELKIAVAGPLASAVLAGAFYLMTLVVPPGLWPVPMAIVKYLAMINAVLVAFNMIPGFPLDGGRVLRALWWLKTGNLDAATRAASYMGRLFAAFLIIMGFIQVLSGNFIGGLWAVLIGFFLQQAAETGYRQLMVKRLLEGLRVRDVMSKGVVVMDAGLTLSDVVERYFFVHHFVSFPVVSGGRLVGLLSLSGVRGVERERWAEVRVDEAMTGVDEIDVLSPAEDLSSAMEKLARSSIGRAPVVEDGRPVAMVSRGDIMRMLEFKSALGG